MHAHTHKHSHTKKSWIFPNYFFIYTMHTHFFLQECVTFSIETCECVCKNNSNILFSSRVLSILSSWTAIKSKILLCSFSAHLLSFMNWILLEFRAKMLKYSWNWFPCRKQRLLHIYTTFLLSAYNTPRWFLLIFF